VVPFSLTTGQRLTDHSLPKSEQQQKWIAKKEV